MKFNALYIQSGGPTSVINCSAYGVIQEFRKHKDTIDKLYAAENGMVGLLKDRFIDIDEISEENIELLKKTPSMAFGSCRYFVKEDSDYERIIEVLTKHNIRYILLNGGNGTVRACKDMLNYFNKKKFDCHIVVIPKTVDNDISCIDHAPGFPSAARHVILTISELAHDLRNYDTDLIMTAEVMGRNTGFLAASCILPIQDGNGPDLIYFPEIIFDPDKFIRDVKRVYEKKGKCFVVVAEGVKTKEGKFLFEMAENWTVKNPEQNMGGVSDYLHRLLAKNFNCKIRCIDLGLMQRCAIHDVSPIDAIEAIEVGRAAVKAVINGNNGAMISIVRDSNKPYKKHLEVIQIADIVKKDATLPLAYLNEDQNFIRDEFADYIRPLVGEMPKYSKIRRK